MRLLFVCVAVLVATPQADAKPKKPKPAPAEPADQPSASGAGAPEDPAPKKHKHKGWPSPAAGPTKSGDPELIFTFDDGPNPRTTPDVLDALAKHHVHATFFMIGEMAASKNKKIPDIVARMEHDGHVIGSHTMTHPDLCRTKLGDDKANAEIDDGIAAIEKATHVLLPWFRTPYGVRCDRVDSMLAARHLHHFHWDLDPQEWKHNDPEKAYAYVTKQLAKMSGRNVLLMHDIKTATVQALPRILDWLEAENARRKIAHERPIRIIAGYELAAEQLPPGLVDALSEAAADVGELPAALASALP